MKILGAELQQWMDEDWPGEDYYWNHDEFDEITDPEVTYDTADLGPLLWQGTGDDPSRGLGMDIDRRINAWRKKRPETKTTSMVEIIRADNAKIETVEVCNCPLCGSEMSTGDEDVPNARRDNHYLSCTGEYCPVRTDSEYGGISAGTLKIWNERA
jgi:hypothetical protein